MSKIDLTERIDEALGCNERWSRTAAEAGGKAVSLFYGEAGHRGQVRFRDPEPHPHPDPGICRKTTGRGVTCRGHAPGSVGAPLQILRTFGEPENRARGKNTLIITLSGETKFIGGDYEVEFIGQRSGGHDQGFLSVSNGTSPPSSFPSSTS
jgi:hypothetical protein